MLTITGEISAINNCSGILTDQSGEYKLSISEALNAFSTLSLYTNAEPCPMVILLSQLNVNFAPTNISSSVLQQFGGPGSQNVFMEPVSSRW
jgi:hypothetical protein